MLNEKFKKLDINLNHSNKTNPIRFKEKFDFFYYHSLKIIEGDQRNDRDNFLETIIQNSKLSEKEKHNFRSRKQSLLDYDLVGFSNLIKESRRHSLSVHKNTTKKIKRLSSIIEDNEFTSKEEKAKHEKEVQKYDYLEDYYKFRKEKTSLSFYNGNELFKYYNKHNTNKNLHEYHQNKPFSNQSTKRELNFNFSNRNFDILSENADRETNRPAQTFRSSSTNYNIIQKFKLKSILNQSIKENQNDSISVSSKNQKSKKQESRDSYKMKNIEKRKKAQDDLMKLRESYYKKEIQRIKKISIIGNDIKKFGKESYILIKESDSKDNNNQLKYINPNENITKKRFMKIKKKFNLITIKNVNIKKIREELKLLNKFQIKRAITPIVRKRRLLRRSMINNIKRSLTAINDNETGSNSYLKSPRKEKNSFILSPKKHISSLKNSEYKSETKIRRLIKNSLDIDDESNTMHINKNSPLMLLKESPKRITAFSLDLKNATSDLPFNSSSVKTQTKLSNFNLSLKSMADDENNKNSAISVNKSQMKNNQNNTNSNQSKQNSILLNLIKASSTESEESEKNNLNSKQYNPNIKNYNYLKQYFPDDTTSKDFEICYNGLRIDVEKLISKNSYSLMASLNPSKHTNLVKLGSLINRYIKTMTIDIDIFLEYMYEKICIIDREIQVFNSKNLLDYFKTNFLPHIQKEFNKIFSIYPQDLKEFMKERYISKFGNPMKSFNTQLNLLLNADKKLLNPSQNLKKSKELERIEEILRNYTSFETIKKYNNNIKKVGRMKILDVPSNFKNAIVNENTLYEKKIKEKINIPKNDYLTCLSKPKFINFKPKLKSFYSFKNSLDYINGIQNNTNNLIMELKSGYKNRSMYVDPSVCVLEIIGNNN